MKINEILTESTDQYTEIEFVCVNPSFPDATPLEKQDELYNALQLIDDVIVIRQDWDHMSDGQMSLSVIYSSDEQRQQILQLAQNIGVEVDIEDSVSASYVHDAANGTLEGQIK